MKRLFKIVTIIVLFPLSAVLAYEPPSTPPKEALENCKIAFIGRIIEIKETSNGTHISEATANIIIHIKICGLDQYEGNIIQMKYSSRYFMEIPHHGFPPNFNISQVYLFVINRPVQKGAVPLLFNPSYKNKIDLAYQFSDDPGFSLKDINKIQKLFSVYTNQVNERGQPLNRDKIEPVSNHYGKTTESRICRSVLPCNRQMK